MAYFPFFVEIKEYRCVIAGGGPVAYRKAMVLREYGAVVTVIAPEFCVEFLNMEKHEDICLEQRCFVDRDLDGAMLVVAATNDRALNHRISDWCGQRKLPVNVVDSTEESSFLFPALVKRQGMTIGISTGGASPVLAQCIRDRVAGAVPEWAADIVGEMELWRPYVKREIEDIGLRSVIYHNLAEHGMRFGAGWDQDIVDKVIQKSKCEKDITEE